MDFNVLPQIYGSLSLFLGQAAIFILKLVVAYIIWLIGKFLINSMIGILKRLDIKKIEFDDSIRNTLIRISEPAAKIVLILVILDFLGVGSSIIGAIAQGLTFTIAITLGLAFGEALKPDAEKLVAKLRQETEIK